MEQKQFIEHLTSIAELRRVKPPVNANLRAATEPNEIFRNGQKFVIDKDNNHTLNWAIKSLKQVPRPCDDCGMLVEDRRVLRAIYSYPYRHWRTSCNVCRRCQHPETKEFSIPITSAPNFFTCYLIKSDK